MIKLSRIVALSILLFGAVGNRAFAQYCALQVPAAPNNTVSVFLETTYNTVSGGLFTAHVAAGGAIPAGNYNAWCIDVATDINNPHDFTYVGGVYSSCDPQLNQKLPAHPNVYVDAATWNKINYLINHRGPCGGLTPTMWEVSQAIWHYVGGPGPASGSAGYPTFRASVVNCMIQAAETATSQGWVPGCGDHVAVIADFDPIPGDAITGDELQLVMIEVPIGCLGDYVWVDTDGNGKQNEVNTGVANVRVDLFACNNLGQPMATTFTDNTGHYLFSDLTQGCYQVKFDKPTGYAFTSQSATATAAGDDSDADANSGLTTQVSLGAGQTILTVDAGLVPRLTLACAAQTVGQVNVPFNAQLVVQGGVPSYTFSLFSGSLPAGLILNANGSITGTPTVAGTFAFTAQVTDSAGGSAKQTVQQSCSITINHLPASLGDVVWNDVNGNGIQDAGEPGVSNVVVKLYTCADSNMVSQTLTSDGSDSNPIGFYRFLGLTPGVGYFVEFTVTNGFVFTQPLATNDVAFDSNVNNANGPATTACIVLGEGEYNPTVDAGVYQPACICGYVYYDANNDGARTGNTGIGGVDVTLNGTNGLGQVVGPITHQTEADGAYCFKDLPPGTYKINETQPTSYQDGKDTIGTPGGTTSNDEFTKIVLVGGFHGVENNFGEILPLTVSVNNDAVCSGHDGSLTATVGDSPVAATPLTYKWTGPGGDLPDSTASITVSVAGNYTVTVTDANGISGSATGTFEIWSLPTLNVSKTDLTCFEANNGTMTATFGAGTPGYKLSVDSGPFNPATSPTVIQNLGPGAHTVTVMDSHGCTATGGVVIGQPPQLVAHAEATPVLCNGGDSTVTVTAIGGTGAYTGTGTFTRKAGTYYFTVKDANGCETTASVTVTEPNALALNLSSTSASCARNDGSITVTFNGGTAPYTISLNGSPTPNVSSPKTFGGLANGNYSVVLTDKNGCSLSKSVVVDLNCPLTLACVSEGTGQVGVPYSSALVASGGTGPYVYSIFSGSLPTGLSLNPNTGVISGTPSAAGDFSFVAQVIDSAAGAAQQTVKQSCTISICKPGLLLTKKALTTQVVSGGVAAYEYTVQNTGCSKLTGVRIVDDYGTPDYFADDVQIGDPFDLNPGETVTRQNVVYLPIKLCGALACDSTDAGYLITQLTPQGLHVTFIQSMNRNDNTYGVNSIGWKPNRPHRFKDLVNSDHAQFTFKNKAGTVVLKFDLDYITATSASPSGYACLGVSGGDGGMITGPSSALVSWDSSLAQNLLKPEFASAAYKVDSPALSDPNSPAWEYRMIYEVTVNPAVFGGIDNFGSVQITDQHNSPPKAGLDSFIPSDCSKCIVNVATATAMAGDKQLSATADAKVCIGTVSTKASLGDRVWIDTDQDGVQDNGEVGLSGVTVKLYNCAGTTLIKTTTTGTDGKYLFSDLAAGDYRILLVLPSGYSFTLTNAGGDDNADSDADPANGWTSCVTLTQGEQNLSLDAGLKKNASTGCLGNFVWFDKNGNGLQDTGEAGMGGVCVALLDCASGATLKTTTTAADGSYQFTSLPAGSYKVKFTAPSGYQFTLQNQGVDDTKDSDANASSGVSDCVTLKAGECNYTVDAGLVGTKLCYTTFTQGGWGAAPSGNNPGSLLAWCFPSVYGSCLSISSGKLQFTCANAIKNYLPAGGTAGILTKSYKDPTSTSAGVFAGQVLALRLNVDLSNKGYLPYGLAQLKVAPGNPLAGKTVAQVLAYCEQALGGGSTPYTISQLNDAADDINNNFDGGTSDDGYLVR